ncbi:MAG: rhomboid family intramembrane serine protease [Microbacter sp.]
MLFSPDMSPEKRRFIHALIVPSISSLIIVLVSVSAFDMGWNLDRLGVYPRTLNGAWGILFHPFIHENWSHLVNNVSTFFILSTALYYFYHSVANRVILIIWLLSGLFLWIIGRESYHIGASGIIYGLAFFLFWSGLIASSVALTAISFIVVFWYGNMVWNMFPLPTNEMISWEGHLSGALAGTIAAFTFRRQLSRYQQHDNASFDDDDHDDDELTQLAMKYTLEEDEQTENNNENNTQEKETSTTDNPNAHK